jgi:hypothetical protein
MIYTFDREAVENGLDMVEPYALISISTPPKFGVGGRSAHLLDEDKSSVILLPDEFRLDVLRLRFNDMDALPDLPPRLRAQYSLYSTEQANQVAAFVRGWQVNLVIHCDAGVSRSQGMADAIADHLGVEVKHSWVGSPNRRVYAMTWHALRPGEDVDSAFGKPDAPRRPKYGIRW